MEKHLLRIFQLEVEHQSRFALMSFADLQAALAARDMDRIWYAVQGLLVAAGNVSKLLWPSRPAIPSRGEQLRASLGISDDSILAPRVFRNHFEHFDERLEEWASSSERKNLVDSSIVPPGAIAGIDAGDFLRNLDPTTLAVTFRGDSYALRPLAQALAELHARAKAETERSPWE